jgi:hypothetical protein
MKAEESHSTTDARRHGRIPPYGSPAVFPNALATEIVERFTVLHLEFHTLRTSLNADALQEASRIALARTIGSLERLHAAVASIRTLVGPVLEASRAVEPSPTGSDASIAVGDRRPKG